MDKEFETVQNILLDNLSMLIEIAGRRESRLMQKNLGAAYDIVDGLAERVSQSQLPKQAIRIILNDARLDMLILLADLKVDILYAHQEMLAPTEKLRTEVRSNIQNVLHTATDEESLNHSILKENIDQIERDLQVIQSVERALRLKAEEP
ncbi:MAG: hypothetical protein WBW71_12115 [Bacteroidota bacterium]